MAFISLLGVFFAFFVLFLFGYVILLIVEKIFMIILSKKLNIKRVFLLLVPFCGSIYECKIINKYMNYGIEFNIIYLAIIYLFRFYVVLYIFYSNNLLTNIFYFLLVFILLFKIIFRIIILNKSGYKIFPSLLLGSFLSSFWSLFLLLKFNNNNFLNVSKN